VLLRSQVIISRRHPRESGDPAPRVCAAYDSHVRYRSRWIPAFAGMTQVCVLLVLLLSLTACHSLFGKDDADSDKPKDEGKRVSALDVSKKPSADKGVTDFKPNLPTPVANKDWPQAGGSTTHTLPQPALSPNPDVIWRADIGNGTSGYFRLLARPVISGGKVFTLDARGTVSAFSMANGDRAWRFDTTPTDRDEAMGGGLGITNNRLYVTTGFGEVIALNAADGKVIWRKMIGKPFRADPTIADDRVYVLSIDNELTALSAKDGNVEWHHNGIAESATLMGASSPAVDGDSVVVAYSSGEIFNLRAQNGRVAWTDVLAVPAQVGALPAIADIRGLPVIDRGRVYAVSHSGRMAAIDQRTGDRVWEVDVGGINTPVVAGDAVFILSNDNELMALTRESGRIVWIKELQHLKDPTDRDSTPMFWQGPVLAGGRLWLTNSLGHLVAFDPNDGGQRADIEVADSFFIPPIVANNMMVLVSDDGRVMGLR